MPRYPGAVWRDVGAPSRFSNGAMHEQLGVVLHVNDAQSDDLFGWITGDNGMSCHFQVNKEGKVYQYIDTAYSSWCQKDGNNTYLSIESQGFASESATSEQVDSIGGILAWIHKVHGMPLQLADAPGQRGFGWHGMGAAHGADWGHPDCPGVRKNQRAAMLTVAKGSSGIPGDPSHHDLSDPIKPFRKEIENMLIQNAADKRGFLVISGKGEWVSGSDWAVLKAAGVPAATVSQELFSKLVVNHKVNN